MTAYNYVKSAFTAMVGNIDSHALRIAIADALPGPAAQLFAGYKGLHFIDDDTTGDPRYRIDFDGTLTAPEKTTLDGVVAAHIGPSVVDPHAGQLLEVMHAWDPPDEDLYYVPWAMQNESTSITNQHVKVFLAGKFKLLNIVCWSSGAAMGSTIFRLYINDVQQASKTVVMSSSFTPYTFDFTTESNVTVKSQSVGLSCDPANDSLAFIRAWSTWERLRV